MRRERLTGRSVIGGCKQYVTTVRRVTTCVLTVGSRYTRPKWYIEFDPEASSTKCRIFPCQVIERDFPNAILPTSMKTRQRDNHPETWGGSRVDLVLSTHKSVGHGLQADKIVLTRILREVSGQGVPAE